MLWALVLHIVTLLFWCAALLYLPTLIAGSHARKVALPESPYAPDSLSRHVFSHVATPAALLAIMSGTAVFLLDRTTEVWLIIKLTLVAGLVVCHALAGLLILRFENSPEKSPRPWCWVLTGVLVVLMTAIVTVVLAKPALDSAPWPL